SLMSAGRWDEAQEILQEILSLDLAPWVRAQPLLFRAHIALARGEQDTATRVLQELRAHAAGAPPEPVRKLPLVQLEIECRLAAGGRGRRRAGAGGRGPRVGGGPLPPVPVAAAGPREAGRRGGGEGPRTARRRPRRAEAGPGAGGRGGPAARPGRAGPRGGVR